MPSQQLPRRPCRECVLRPYVCPPKAGGGEKQEVPGVPAFVTGEYLLRPHEITRGSRVRKRRFYMGVGPPAHTPVRLTLVQANASHRIWGRPRPETGGRYDAG